MTTIGVPERAGIIEAVKQLSFHLAAGLRRGAPQLGENPVDHLGLGKEGDDAYLVSALGTSNDGPSRESKVGFDPLELC